VVIVGVIASDVVLNIDLDDHEHTQRGEAGKAVTGTYS